MLMTLISNKQQIVAKQEGSCQFGFTFDSSENPQHQMFLSRTVRGLSLLHCRFLPISVCCHASIRWSCMSCNDQRASCFRQRPHLNVSCWNHPGHLVLPGHKTPHCFGPLRKAKSDSLFLKQKETTKNSVKNQRFELQRQSHWHTMHLLLGSFELYCMLMWNPLIFKGIPLSKEKHRLVTSEPSFGTVSCNDAANESRQHLPDSVLL